MNLSGHRPISLDDKGRMAVPTTYRNDLLEICEGRLVLTADPDYYCLLLYTPDAWKEVEEKVAKLPTADHHSRHLKRMLLGHADPVKIDSHGRILIPQALREYARIDDQIVLSGQATRFEIWSKERWDQIIAERSGIKPEEEIPPHILGLSW